MKLQLKSLLILVLAVFIFGCKKKKDNEEETVYSLAELSTTAMSSVTATSAIAGGNISANGNSPVTERGICWSTSSGPTISGTHTVLGSGNGSFSHTITGLQPGTNYYVRSYAINQVGTSYGNEVSFKTGAAWYVSKQTFQYSSLYATATGLYGYVTNNVGIGYSADGGTTWTSITGNSSLSSTSQLMQHGSYLFAVGGGGAGGVYRASDNSGSWTLMNNGLPSNPNVSCIASAGTDLFIGIGASGVYKSSDDGATWTAANTGINLVGGNFCTRLHFHNGVLFAGFYSNIYKSTDGGANWASSINLGGGNYVRDFLSVGGKLYAAMSGGGLTVSSDNGGSWTPAIVSAGAGWSIAEKSGDVYASFDNGAFKIDAGTTNSTNITNGLTAGANTYFYSLAVKGNYLMLVEVKTSPSNFALYKYPL